MLPEVTDVGTETERADELVARANKLDLLERLADDLAHEIKNPLHSMVINLEVLKRRVSRWNAEEQQEAQRYIGVLATELDRVTRRIDLLLRLSRPARGSEPVTLDELVQELVELIQLEGRRHEVEVRFEPAGEIARVNVPRDPVRQVVLDVVLEALDAAGTGGALVIRTARRGDRAALSVSARGRAGEPVLLSGDPPTPTGATVARIPAARVVAERFGGRIEVADSPPSPSADGTDGPVVVFSIPVAGG